MGDVAKSSAVTPVLEQEALGQADRGAARQGQAYAAFADDQAQPAGAAVPYPAHGNGATIAQHQ